MRSRLSPKRPNRDRASGDRDLPGADLQEEEIFGSIPAWTGEPMRRSSTRSRSWVDPSVGGGAAQRLHAGWQVSGRSPRGRGSRLWTMGVKDRAGSIPRGRGSSRSPGPAVPPRGSIPAWAGEPPALLDVGVRRWVDPRVGGGAGGVLGERAATRGRSPRGRGSRDELGERRRARGSIPAWAGEPPQTEATLPGIAVDPRVGGGASSSLPSRCSGTGRSPRGRGSRRPVPCRHHRARSIPAWAGEPLVTGMAKPCSGVDPRVGGGAGTNDFLRIAMRGRSPRGRGSPWQDC